MSEREEGYYWLKVSDETGYEWLIAEWGGDYWWLSGEPMQSTDEEFDEIGPRVTFDQEQRIRELERCLRDLQFGLNYMLRHGEWGSEIEDLASTRLRQAEALLNQQEEPK